MPRALIVEDEPEANRLLAALLKLRGCETVSVFDAAQALAVLESSPPDVVFLDLMLPDLNGYEVCGRIKARPATCLVPVVIVTARLAAENRLKSFELGAQAFVPKPYVPGQIFAALETALSWSREVAACGGRGTIHFGDSIETFHLDLGRFRGLLLARGDLDGPAVGQIVDSLCAIGMDAHCWGTSQGESLVAAADYVIEDERLVVTIRDKAGWFAGGDLTEAAAAFDPALDEVFDEVRRDDDGREVQLVKTLGGQASRAEP